MDTVESLKNLYENYSFRQRPDSSSQLSKIDKLRWLGGMEALLQCLGKLPSGMPFDYEIKEKKVFCITYKIRESYEDFILRHSCEFLTVSQSQPEKL